jgi:hypothetical protein
MTVREILDALEGRSPDEIVYVDRHGYQQPASTIRVVWYNRTSNSCRAEVEFDDEPRPDSPPHGILIL